MNASSPLRLYRLLLLTLLFTGCSPMCGMVWDTTMLSAFKDAQPPKAPDYTLPQSWGALPDTNDGADVVPAGEQDLQSSATADVFYIHPTTFYVPPAGWNAPLDRADINALTDDTLRGQASVFNGVGRVFAPRYRQTSIYAQFKGDQQGVIASFELAYDDIRRAFTRYLEVHNQGRPIIIAAHSQGSFHALRLLEEFFNSKPLRSKLVAAYVVGMFFTEDQLARVVPEIPLCTSKEQTGCLVTWNTLGPKATTDFANNALLYFSDHYESGQGKQFVCVNPLSWTTGPERVPASENLGGVLFEPGGEGAQPTPDVGIADAECRDGMLRITRPADPRYNDTVLGEDVYHLFDYALYYVNVRRNAEVRLRSYEAQRP